MRTSARGFTLIEMLVAMAVAGILSSVAYPSFQGQIHKVRRSDVLVSMMQVQLAQERWRANGSSHGSLAEVGVASTSPAGYYDLRVTSNHASGYEVLATATGTQARDSTCRHLRLNVAQANVTYSSGPDASTDNPPALNRQCWNL
jgi:type IV pilus assembly protein PilE